MFLACLIDLGAPLDKITMDLQSLCLGQEFIFDLQRDCPRGFAGLRLKVKLQHGADWDAPEIVDEKLRLESEAFKILPLQIDELPAHRHILKSGHAHRHDHEHRNYIDIKNIIAASRFSERVKTRATQVFRVLAEAEGRVHGKPAEEVHFHEVGALDSIIDIIGSCLALEYLNIDYILCTSIGIAQGIVNCAHGQLPLPAPATQHLLLGCPVIQQPENRELCTPTGAALIKALAQFEFPDHELTPVAIGIGLSHRIPKVAPPFLRATLLSNQTSSSSMVSQPWIKENLLWITCDIDDMNPESVPPLQDRLLKCGFLEVNFAPLHMKKGRMGFELRILCHHHSKDLAIKNLFDYSSTFGCRIENVERYSLPREIKNIETPWGDVRVKVALGQNTPKYHIEFEDVAKICEQENLAWSTVVQNVHKLI
jgi:pyridinium-3,5-bisthiocarboxylic acid mononucleotide nickel chelatase